MPSGYMPTYGYRPAAGSPPSIRAKSNTRARLFEGGTYFRARNLGSDGNNISIEVVIEAGQGKVVVTNHNTVFAENVTGPAQIKLLEQQLDWRERYTIENLTTRPTLKKYSISLQIGATLVQDMGTYAPGTLINIPDKLQTIVTLPTSGVSPTDVITFKARTRVYTLSYVTNSFPDGSVSQGWGIAGLRQAVNASDPWIEMLARSGPMMMPDGTMGAAPNPPFDVQDTGSDALVLAPFAKTYMQGGDGLPQVPDHERTGPTRSIILVNQGEQQNGALGDINKIYEWAGDSSTAGSWKEY